MARLTRSCSRQEAKTKRGPEIGVQVVNFHELSLTVKRRVGNNSFVEQRRAAFICAGPGFYQVN